MKYWIEHKSHFISKIWKAYIPPDQNRGIKKTIHVGYYSTENEAALAYNEMELKLYKDDAILNVIVDLNQSTETLRLLKINFDKKRVVVSRTITETISIINDNTNTKNRSDNEAIISFLNGNEAAIEKIIIRYKPFWEIIIEKYNRLHKISKSRIREIRGYHTKDDIISESIIKMTSALKRGLFDGKNFRSWSISCVKNQRIIMWRKEYERKKQPQINPNFYDYVKLWASV